MLGAQGRRIFFPTVYPIFSSGPALMMSILRQLAGLNPDDQHALSVSLGIQQVSAHVLGDLHARACDAGLVVATRF